MQYLGKQRLALLVLTIMLAPAILYGQTGGTLDASFGTNGKVTTDFGGTGAAARTVAVQADGKILEAGIAVFNGVADFALARSTPALARVASGSSASLARPGTRSSSAIRNAAFGAIQACRR